MSAMLGPQIDFCPPYAAWRFFSFFDTANPEENNLCSKSATRRPSSRRPLSNRGCCSNPAMGIRHRTERNRTPVARIRSAEIEAHKNRDGNVEVDVTAGCRVGRTGARMGKHSGGFGTEDKNFPGASYERSVDADRTRNIFSFIAPVIRASVYINGSCRYIKFS